ncbi:tRNA epoxyqueuosine(34) reductase QueG [Succinimonas sp.]|uniref:tRNA epoxyqueuosine(34) reductase QueG n=2 Tax=Succinimonas sp. TaxID=1936151 RepID=UPI00386CE0AF
MTAVSKDSDASGINIPELMEAIAQKARELGLIPLGYAPAALAPLGEKSFREHLRVGIPAGVAYLSKNQEARNDPSLILPNCSLIMSFALPYYQENLPEDPETGRISIYALGRDYHKTLRKKLDLIGKHLKNLVPGCNTRAITDSAPFYEQFFAEMTGLAFRGRNNLVRVNQGGSWVFLGELLTDIPGAVSESRPFSAGEQAPAPCPPGCRKCQTRCPGGAFTPQGFKIERCLSYLTIENPGEIPPEMIPALGNRIYGCDECQLVCPENRKLLRHPPAPDPDFKCRYSRELLSISALLDLTEEEFLRIFAGSPVYRIGYQAFMRNVFAAAANAPGNPEILRKLKAPRDTACPITLREAVRAQSAKFSENGEA